MDNNVGCSPRTKSHPTVDLHRNSIFTCTLRLTAGTALEKGRAATATRVEARDMIMAGIVR